ncbi:MAG: hypothetical protein C5B51_08875 [Terriglobia bacterium]|nr:MAG: hypothetical protein C5B51_08875 [Terriglobia bacterium]
MAAPCVNTGCSRTYTTVASAYAAYMACGVADFGVTIDGGVRKPSDDVLSNLERGHQRAKDRLAIRHYVAEIDRYRRALE